MLDNNDIVLHWMAVTLEIGADRFTQAGPWQALPVIDPARLRPIAKREYLSISNKQRFGYFILLG
jgi:hypothetical protein